MKKRRLTIGLFTVFALVAFSLTSCEKVTGPEAPMVQTSVVGQSSAVHLMGLSPKVTGLAKHHHFDWRHSRFITARFGGVLGGPQTGGNYVEIPPNTLQHNMFMTFSLDQEDGVLVFAISAWGQDESEHIQFQDGQTSVIAVSKDWLQQAPDVIVNYDNPDEVISGVIETPTHYLIHVPHFSRWAWGWTVG